MKTFNLILSNTTREGYDALFDLLRAQDRGKDRKHVVIVPDRFTYGVEKELCEKVFPGGTFNTDVVTFTRLAQKTIGDQRPCLSKEGTVLLLNRLIRERNDDLTLYKGVKSVAFAREMFASIALLRSSGITVAQLRAAAKEIDGSVKEKLCDVATLYEAYNDATKEDFFDTISRVEQLTTDLHAHEELTGAHIYLLGFNMYNALQLAFIEEAMLRCESVSVAFCEGSRTGNDYCFPTNQRELLERFAEENGVRICRTYAKKLALTPTVRYLHDNLFSKSSSEKTDWEGVYVASYDDPYEEVRAVAQEINYLVYHDKIRYKNIAVACNDARYNGLLKTTFERYDVSFFIDEKHEVRRGFLARYVLQAFACKTSNMDVREVMPFLRHPYSGYTRGEMQTFGAYCVKYGVDREAFLSAFTCADARTEEIRSVLKEKIGSIPDRATAKEYSDLIADWAAQIEEAQENRKKTEGAEADAVRELEKSTYAKSDRFLAVVKEIGDQLGAHALDAEEYVDALNAMLENMTYSELPPYADAVFVGNTGESRFNDVKILFVVGATEAYFPITAGDNLIFGCYDIQTMKNHALPVFPSPEDSNAFERFAVIDLVTKANELLVSYPKTDFDGVKNTEGIAVRELKARLRVPKSADGKETAPIPERPFIDRHFHENDPDKQKEIAAKRLMYRMSTPKNCRFEYVAGRVPAEYRETVKAYLVGKGLFSEKGAAAAPPDLLSAYRRTDDGKAVLLSASAMETYFQCPYRNYLQNVVGLREKETGEFRVCDVGTILHEALEKYFDPHARNVRTLPDDAHRDAAIRAVLDEVFDPKQPRYASFLTTASGKREFAKLREEGERVLKKLTALHQASALDVEACELRVDGGEIVFSSRGVDFTFKGYVDRVDTDGEDGVVIVDYKTGRIHEQLQDIYVGNKIQLYVYLQFFLNRGKRPLGVFYLPIPDGYGDKAPDFSMKGQMLGDLDTFRKLDTGINGAQSDKYESPNVDFILEKKDGAFVFSKKNEKNRVREEDFKTISDYVMALVKKATEELADGYMAKKPLGNACEYCPYRVLCGEDVETRKTVSAKKVGVGSFSTQP